MARMHVLCCALCCAGKFKVSNNCAFTWPKGQYGMCGDPAGQSRWMQSTTPKTFKAGDTLKIQVCGAAVCQQTECMFSRMLTSIHSSR
jgi:hypothetical protein